MPEMLSLDRGVFRLYRFPEQSRPAEYRVRTQRMCERLYETMISRFDVRLLLLAAGKTLASMP